MKQRQVDFPERRSLPDTRHPPEGRPSPSWLTSWLESPDVFLLLYCRPGFEAECTAEIQAKAGAQGILGYGKTTLGSGEVRFHADPVSGLARLLSGLDFAELCFSRQWVVAREIPPLLSQDRVSGLIAELGERAVGGFFLETLDTAAGKLLAPLCRQLEPHLRRALEQRGQLRADRPGLPRWHLCFLSSTHVCLGFSDPTNAAPWPMGFPRLKRPPRAPSRSGLKLDEAFLSFLSPAELTERLQPGMQAVDLGAAPGGWSWQLVRRGLWVTAIDNGPLAPELLATGRVRHLQVDGFRYRPPRQVDWLVCDIVEQPERIARLMAHWFVQGWCRNAIFNLKLPMRKRYEEVQRCRAIILDQLPPRAYRLRLRHLYHDREEVSGYLSRLEQAPASRS